MRGPAVTPGPQKVSKTKPRGGNHGCHPFSKRGRRDPLQGEVPRLELGQDPFAQCRYVGRGGVQFFEGLQQVLRSWGDLGVGGHDFAAAVLEHEEAFLAAALAAFRAVLAVHLDDVQGVVDHGGVGDGAADAVGVADRVEVEDALDVYAAGGEDLDVLEAVAVELPAGLQDEVPEVAAAVTGGIEPDSVDRVRDGSGGQERPELLVVEGVYEDRARDVFSDHLVEGAGGFRGRAQDEDEGVGDGAGRGDPQPFGGEFDGDPVAATEVSSPLYHGRDRGVHPARPEGDQGTLARRHLAARRPGSHPRGFAEEAQDGRFVLGKGAVGPGERQNRLVGVADRALRHGSYLGLYPFQQPGYLVEAGDDEPILLVGGLVRNLYVDRGVFEPAGAQDFHRAVEIDVRDRGVPDLLFGGRVEPRQPAASGAFPGFARVFVQDRALSANDLSRVS